VRFQNFSEVTPGLAIALALALIGTPPDREMGEQCSQMQGELAEGHGIGSGARERDRDVSAGKVGLPRVRYLQLCQCQISGLFTILGRTILAGSAALAAQTDVFAVRRPMLLKDVVRGLKEKRT
jgi:hypothetical protein